MLDRFSATVEKLYLAAAGGLPWREALIAVEDLTGSTGAVIDLVPTDPDVPRMTFAGSFSDDNCREYARDYQAICPRIRFALQHPEAATQYDYLFMSEREMDRDPVYHWLGSHGLRYYLGANLVETPAFLAFWSLQRSARQGHAEARDVQLFELLKPHISRATSLAIQLGTLQSSNQLGSSILEMLPQAVFALSAAGHVAFANAAALRLVAKADGLRIDDGRLTTCSSADQAPLDRLIQAIVHSRIVTGSSGWTKASRAGDSPPYAIFVAPLAVQDDLLRIAAARLLVIVHDPTARGTADPAMLVKVYGLTETEARVAGAICAGHSVESAAASLNMGIATARSHLKAVFAKLRVNRQQDLVRLLTSLSSMKLRADVASPDR